MTNTKSFSKRKLIVILGPTASGKSDLAVKLALLLGSEQAKKKFGIKGAEIVSADSRQVYKGMDIGTGKITKKEMQGIPHHLLDVASPKRRFTVVQFVKKAKEAIKKIYKKNKIPIVCGGTAFYIYALTDGLIIPEVKPDWKLRKKLEKLSPEKLYQKLKKLDPQRAKTIEKNNKRRLIRALEIVIKTKKPVPKLKRKPEFNCLFIGIKHGKIKLKSLIHKRLKKRLKQGMINEVKKLKKTGLSWKRLEEFGLEYKWVSLYLQDKIDYKQMVERLENDICNFAKRQMTWFKKLARQQSEPQEIVSGNKKIHWVKNFNQAKKLVMDFLKNPPS